MKIKINYPALIPYFLCIVTYSFAAIMNKELMEQLFIFKELSYTSVENIHYYDIIGYIVGGITLLIFGNHFSFRKILILSLLIYFLSLISISFLDLTIKLTQIYSMIYSATNFIIFTILLCYIFNDKKIHNFEALSVFFISICAAYFLVVYCLSFISTSHNSINMNLIHKLVKLNVTPVAIFLFIFTFASSFNLTIKSKNANSLMILKNIELELLSAFVVFYVLMSIINGYEVYTLTDSLLMISISVAKYYIFTAMIITAIFAPRFIFRYNAHKINILCITVLLLMFFSMPFWGTNIIFGSVCWFIIGTLLYTYFWSNMFLLAEKFESPYLQLTIILYSLAASVGYYCGYITMDVSEDTIGKNGFLVAICFVLFFLLAYYLYLYRKNNLKQW
jgi:hypothetical protein